MAEKIYKINPLLLDLPVPIQTPRLILSPPKLNEGSTIAEAVRESWDILNRYEDWAKNIEIEGSNEYWEIKTRKSMADFITRDHLNFRIYDSSSKRFIGIADISYPNWEIRSFIVGYWIRKSDQNKGFATEACNALTRYCFEILSAR